MVDYQKIKVRKASGELEPFSEEKVRSSLRRAGAKKELIDEIITQVKTKLFEGISTKEIYTHVYRFLKQAQSPLVSKYGLRHAIMQLGPSGYPFEKFVAGILKCEGFQTEVGQIVRGKCVNHEIDVVAQKDNQLFMIECKFHNRPGIKSDIKVALYTYARFLDLQHAWQNKVDHAQKFHQSWLVTNTKVTSEVKTYAKCVEMQVVSWNYPDDYNLQFLIEKHDLHPITCLTSLSKSQKKTILDRGVVFCSDLVEKKIDFLPDDLAAEVHKECKRVTAL